MAATVISGTSNPTYTNNTGQNVRVIINYMQGVASIPTFDASGVPPQQSTTGPTGITLKWTTTSGSEASVNAPGALAMGRSLAFCYGGGNPSSTSLNLTIAASNMVPYESGAAQFSNNGLPTEIMLAPTQRFSAVCAAYNILIIPENG